MPEHQAMVFVYVYVGIENWSTPLGTVGDVSLRIDKPLCISICIDVVGQVSHHEDHHELDHGHKLDNCVDDEVSGNVTWLKLFDEIEVRNRTVLSPPDLLQPYRDDEAMPNTPKPRKEMPSSTMRRSLSHHTNMFAYLLTRVILNGIRTCHHWAAQWHSDFGPGTSVAASNWSEAVSLRQWGEGLESRLFE